MSETRNHGYDVIVGGHYVAYDTDHRKLVTLNPNSNQQAPDATSFFPVGGMSLQAVGLKDPLRKVRTLWHCSRAKGSVALYLIDRGDIRSAIDRCSNIWASLPGAGYGQFEHKAGQPDGNQRSGRNVVREIDVLAVTAIISALANCIIVCLSWAVNHYRDNAITCCRRQNARELKLANAAITDMQMRQRDVIMPDAKRRRS